MRIVILIASFSGMGFMLLASNAAEDGPRSPLEEASSFQLADPTLTIELVASEPNIVSPVAGSWDEHGKLFVAEMTDYPSAPTGGRIRCLEDRDHNGHYETATTFAEGLPFPNGVLAMDGGVLVTAAPNIWFLVDRDGDGVADDKRVVLTGFAEGNQQLRANGLLLGLDGWIYVANGRSGGAIRRPDELEDKAIPLGQSDLRFRFPTGEFELVTGMSQFGMGRNDLGDRFLSWNTVPLRQVVIEDRFLARNPHWAAPEGWVSLIAPENGRIFSAAPRPTTFNKEPVDFFNASCGTMIFRGAGLGGHYRGNAFVCEPLTNLVHRSILTRNQATCEVQLLEGNDNREFLASTDPWFHPVHLATGPDDALYVFDFYRKWVEHPQFVAESLRNGVDFRIGAANGRIWRIRPKSPIPEVPISSKTPGAMLPTQWIAALEDPMSWRRETASRLLASWLREHDQDADLVKQLKALVLDEAKPELARISALWLLGNQRQLDEATLLTTMNSEFPTIRETAVRVAEECPFVSERIEAELVRLSTDSSERVRLQAVLGLGRYSSHDATRALAKAAINPDNGAPMAMAIVSGLAGRKGLFLETLLEGYTGSQRDARPFAWMSEAAMVAGIECDPTEIRRIVDSHLKSLPRLPLEFASPYFASLFLGLEQGMKRRSDGFRLAELLPEHRENLGSLQNSWRELATKEDDDAVRCLQAIALMDPVDARNTSIQLLTQTDGLHPKSVESAIQAIVANEGPMGYQGVIDRWNTLGVRTRQILLDACIRRDDLAPMVLGALEDDRVDPSEVDLTLRNLLTTHKDESVRTRAVAIFPPIDRTQRQAVINQYLSAIPRTGDRAKGEIVFKASCSKCHSFASFGNRVGPELSGIGRKPRETLIVDILDPSRELAPDFRQVTIELSSGDVRSGILVSESKGSLVLRRSGGVEDRILRSDVDRLTHSPLSLMPDGFERELNPVDVANLLEYLAPQ